MAWEGTTTTTAAAPVPIRRPPESEGGTDRAGTPKLQFPRLTFLPPPPATQSSSILPGPCSACGCRPTGEGGEEGKGGVGVAKTPLGAPPRQGREAACGQCQHAQPVHLAQGRAIASPPPPAVSQGEKPTTHPWPESPPPRTRQRDSKLSPTPTPTPACCEGGQGGRG